ncbi:transcription antitermination factor NusB [Clostridium frigidicarnis]|uniref:Transcription antitermination protein NusB n=1 Tax=Clostridium frigidicarnis TaxID=84698 RepID=A0A1I0WHI6_9CLOT|nr:transcription antitermination factor NusB [Clostridium frigidicarnis]SFA87698.1 NusB antitermination factor [Clostridium frigidicarnis]
MNRKKSREVAMELLFENAIKKDDLKDLMEDFKEHTDHDLNELDMVYINKVIYGVRNNIEKIDSDIEKYLNQWKLTRISKVNLSILRLSTYEILFEDDIPFKVSINEGVELAKKYSDEPSIKFINGVLDKIAKQ